MMSSTCIVRTAMVRKPDLGLGLVSFGLGLDLVVLVLVLVLRIWSCLHHCLSLREFAVNVGVFSSSNHVSKFTSTLCLKKRANIGKL